MPRRLYPGRAPFETVNQLLDALKTKYECSSENQLAIEMEWTPSKLRNYRKGRSRPADAEAMEIAQKLAIDDGMVVAICHAEREENAQVKAMWLHLARQLSRIVGPALALGFLAIGAQPTSSHAASVDAPSQYYDKRRWWTDRRRRRASRPAVAAA